MNELIFKTMLSLQPIFFTFMLRTAKGAFADNKQLAKSNPAVKKNKKSTNSTKKVDILTPNRRIQKLF